MWLLDRFRPEHDEASVEALIAPGKRTLTASFPPSAVQRKAAPAPTAATAEPAEAGPGATDPFWFCEGATSTATGMPAPVQAKMERAFGADFSAVRIHQSGEADALGARAFTHGHDIHFAPGEYAPHDPAGQALLGHELAHVVQQASGRVAPTTQAKGRAINDNAALEREADEHGERAARGEPVGGSAGGTVGGAAVVQRARKGKDGEHKPIVKGYPTREGDDADEGDLPLDPACLALIVDGIIPALVELGPASLKEGKRRPDDDDPSLTGYMIGVARTRSGKFVASTSGAAPDAAVAVLRQFADNVVRSNVPAPIANQFVQGKDGAQHNRELDRYQIVHRHESGGMAGFCAAFKILYAHPLQEFVGMAEVVYAPQRQPAPRIVSGDGEVVTYDHGDVVPSCVTCQAAIHQLLERGQRMRAPKVVTKRTTSSKPQPVPRSEAEILAGRVESLQRDAGAMQALPGELGDILRGLSTQQRKTMGVLVDTIATGLIAPIERLTALIAADVDVLAEDDILPGLLRQVVDSYYDAKPTISLGVGDAKKELRTGKTSLHDTYEKVLTPLAAAVQRLNSYVQTLQVEEDGGAEDDAAPAQGAGTLGSRLAADADVDANAEANRERWSELAAPPGMGDISAVVTDPSAKGQLWLYDEDAIWELDLRTGKLTRDPPLEASEPTSASSGGASSANHGAASSHGGLKPGQVDALLEAMENVLAKQASFVLAVSSLPTYMNVVNASDAGDNCLIFSIAAAGGKPMNAERAGEIRKTIGAPAEGFLGTDNIAGIAAELGIARPIVVIRTDGHDGGSRFSAEMPDLLADAIYLVNANQIHFGWATVRPEVTVEPDDHHDDTGIKFVVQM